jgi:hypothetical protein
MLAVFIISETRRVLFPFPVRTSMAWAPGKRDQHMVCTYREYALRQNPCPGKGNGGSYEQGAFLFFVGSFLSARRASI